MKNLKSVGIDIGTTSTHLVFSELQVCNKAAGSEIPRPSITRREVIYQSQIHFTPLKKDGSIDAVGIKELLAREYAEAGVNPDEIDCGAVIITGESARLRNAQEVLAEISALAGDFVSASAGPGLESILAARGSGAAQHSLETGSTICNIDIGGGTTNIAVFSSGEPIETGCLRIGARCLQFSKDGRLTKCSASGKLILDWFGETDQRWDERIAERLADSIGKLICEAVTASRVNAWRTDSSLTDLWLGEPLRFEQKVDEYWLSGGVAELIKASTGDPYRYGDFGCFLANGLTKAMKNQGLPFFLPDRPIRATVIGAGSYTTQLSGNTVSSSDSCLPIKGVPLLRPFTQAVMGKVLGDKNVMEARLRKAISHFCEAHFDRQETSRPDLEQRQHHIDYESTLNSKGPFALVIEKIEDLSFQNLMILSENLSTALINCQIAAPYILVLKEDAAMALGQLMKGHLKARSIIVLDGLDVDFGDFIDIGKPIGTGGSIPVTIKSLIFNC